MFGDKARPHIPWTIRSKSDQQFVPFNPGSHRRSFPNRPDRKLEAERGDPGYSAGTIRGDARQPHQDATRTHRSTGRCGDASTSRGPGQPESVRVLSEWESAREELGPCADSTASSTSSPDGPRPIQSPSRQEFGQSCAAQKRIPVVVRREF